VTQSSVDQDDVRAQVLAQSIGGYVGPHAICYTTAEGRASDYVDHLRRSQRQGGADWLIAQDVRELISDVRRTKAVPVAELRSIVERADAVAEQAAALARQANEGRYGGEPHRQHKPDPDPAGAAADVVLDLVDAVLDLLGAPPRGNGSSDA